MNRALFPDNFTWGAASSSYQIEGGAVADGKGASVWDVFCKRAGATRGGHTGDVACDHYRRWREDVAMMREMGIRAYRFSVSWPRVMPEGTGRVNAKGLGFYDALVDGLLEAGIEPWVTLFHWDYPEALQQRGGWMDRESAEWFAEYARVVVSRLSDRVTKWITINEPQIFIGLGHGDGTHAPGLKLTFAERLKATHHVLMAHGRATQEIRAHAKRASVVGWAPCGRVESPATDSVRDIDAARRSTFSITQRDSWNNTWYGDPVCLGRYPEDGLRLFGSDAPAFTEAEMRTIAQPLDFYGVNIYSGDRVVAGADGQPERVPFAPGFPQTSMRWNITPESLYWGTRFLHERYGIPMVITENGMSGLDWVEGEHGATGGVSIARRVRDPQRVDYTRAYLLELARAVRDGVDVRGYFHWSIMDNFEWAEGYTQRFGLVHVDFETGERTPKDSAWWYKGVIESGGATLMPGAGEAGSVVVKPAVATEGVR